jgi:hypothetical protein
VLALALLKLPLALGGEALTGNNSAIGALSIVSMIGGYLFLGGLWFFVFRRRKRRDGDDRDPDDHGE